MDPADPRQSLTDSDDGTSPASRNDNYPSYLRDTFGYTYDATDRVSLKQRERHFALRDATPDALSDLRTDDLNDFEQLAVARAWLRHDDLDRFVRSTDAILAEPTDHPAVRYPEVALLAAYTLGDAGDPDRGLDYLSTHESRFESDRDCRELDVVRGRLHLQANQPDRADDAFQRACDLSDDAETRLDVATECARIDETDVARTWLDRADALAREQDDSALLVDIEVWQSRLDA